MHKKKARSGSSRSIGGLDLPGTGGGRNQDPFYDQELPVDGIAAVSKSHELDAEVQAYIDQEHLGAIERASYLLQNGSQIQQTSVLEGLHRLVQELKEDEMTRLIAELNEIIWKLEEEMQKLAAESLVKAIALNVFTPSHLSDLLGLIKTMIGIRSEEVRLKWKPVILEAIDYFQPEQLETDVLQFAIERGELSETQDSRQLCCEMLGAFARRLDGTAVEKYFLSHALPLCQDTDYAVRISMCEQLNSFSRAIGLQRCKEVVTKELFELLADEEKEVARAALSCLVDILDFFDAAYRREHILPMFKSYVVSPPEDSHQLLVNLFGKYLWELSNDITTDEEFLSFCNFFKSACQRPDQDTGAPTLRSLCAYNFPAVVKSIGVKRYTSYLAATYKSLCEDSCVETRRRMAAGFHEVCNTLGDKAFQLLKDPFVYLVQDAELEVQEAIFSNLSSIFKQFFESSEVPEEAAKQSVLAACVQPICTYENNVKSSWRKVSALLDHFECFPDFFSTEVLYETFIPILSRHLTSGPAAIKDKCAKYTMLFTRKLNNNTQQVEIFSRMLNDFGKSKSFWHRQTFVHICFHCLQHFSKKFFREKMMEIVIDLAKDPVSNVRARVCTLLPHLKKVFRPPAPVDQVANFNEKVTKLLIDPDKDVREAAKQAAEDMEELELEWQRRRDLKIPDEEELQDISKEDEENTLVEAAHEQEKQQRRKALRELIAEGEKNMPTSAPGRPTQLTGRGRGALGIKKPMTGGPERSPAPLNGKSTSLAAGKHTKTDFARLPAAGAETRKLSFVGPEGGRPRKLSMNAPSGSSLSSTLPTLPNSRTGLTAKKK